MCVLVRTRETYYGLYVIRPERYPEPLPMRRQLRTAVR